jgi:hypothetical protein
VAALAIISKHILAFCTPIQLPTTIGHVPHICGQTVADMPFDGSPFHPSFVKPPHHVGQLQLLQVSDPGLRPGPLSHSILSTFVH